MVIYYTACTFNSGNYLGVGVEIKSYFALLAQTRQNISRWGNETESERDCDISP